MLPELKVRPGISSSAQPYLSHLNNEQMDIVRRLSNEWYITNGGGRINLATSEYNCFLMKPPENYQELFNLEREIVVVFSDYDTFQPRTLDAFEAAYNKFSDLRIDKVCSVLISKDPNIEQKIRDLLKSDPEYQVVVPFYYNELLNCRDDFFIRNRFKEYFYSRDLFAFQSPLRKDLYFFGRTDLIHKIVNRHRSNENSGLFGLRKTGKTSVIFGIQRAAQASDNVSVFIDCQNPSFHKSRWNKSLRHIIEQTKEQLKLEFLIEDENKYTEEEATNAFERDLKKIYKKTSQKSLLIIFDEIEQITPTISPSTHWTNDSDFIFFWQSLRSLFQKLNGVFTYLIVGTNPKSVETSVINGIDNPIFNQIPYEYIAPFDVPQTREMVKKLGRIMGLKFDEIIYSKLTEDFGGHPFLIRTVCSAINKVSNVEKPVRVDKSLYEKGKKKFNEEYQNYIEMILTVLEQYYNDEYEMLKFLALDDIDTFKGFASNSPQYTNHLLGYNIIDKNYETYSFRIEAVKQHLVNNNKYQKIGLTDAERLEEISQRRNIIEPKLRHIIRTLLKAKYGERLAKDKILDIMGNPRKSKYSAYTLKDVFDPNKSEIYLEDLRKLVFAEWGVFDITFGKDKDEFSEKMKSINKYRADAHAKSISKDEMDYFRVCATKIEKLINDF